MEKSHDIFIEKEIVWENNEPTTKKISVQDAIKSMCYTRWVEPTLEKFGSTFKELYILLVCIPSWTKAERDWYIKQYKEQILDAWNTVNVEYLKHLYVSIPRANKEYTAKQFLEYQEYVTEQLGIELLQTA